MFEVANRRCGKLAEDHHVSDGNPVREHQLQLRRRTESVKRIHRATDTLEDRIGELEQMDDIVEQITQHQFMREVYQSLNAQALSRTGCRLTSR